jgi:hypothetical protein
VFVVSIGFAAGPVGAAPVSSRDSAPTVPLSIGPPSARATLPPGTQRADPGRRAARAGWYCPIGTCDSRPAGSAVRTAISFGVAALIAGLIARRRSARPV